MAVEIEAASYPEDEAASPENMRFRSANAGDFFLEATLKTSVSVGGQKSITPLSHSSLVGVPSAPIGERDPRCHSSF